jgi:hypothetical protein
MDFAKVWISANLAPGIARGVCTMADYPVPPGTPEAWDLDDLSRLRRVHEDLEREYRRIPEGPYRREYGGNVPSAGEGSSEH